MKSDYLRDFGIFPAEYDLELREDPHGTYKLCFLRFGVVLYSLDLSDARMLQVIMLSAGERDKAEEIGQKLKAA